MSTSAIDAAAALSRCVLFCALSDSDLRQLAAKAHRRRYRAGQPIFHVGDPGDCLIAILEGTVRVSLTTASGREIILSDLPQGEIFGEVALIDGLGRSADAAALTEVTLLTVDRTDALRFLAKSPEACLRLLGIVCARLRESDERMSDIATAELGVRLAKAILRKAPSDPSAALRISLSQGDLAAMISGSREAVNRQLAQWQRSGLVTLGDGRIEINRQSELAAIAGLI